MFSQIWAVILALKKGLKQKTMYQKLSDIWASEVNYYH